MTARRKPRRGWVTLPAEAGREETTLRLAEKWGADAIRDCDGTRLSPEMLHLGYEIYSTFCLVRADQDWARSHRDHLHQKFLMSDPVAATSSCVVIDPMATFFRKKYIIDGKHDPKKYWEVIDRTTGEVVDPVLWNFDSRTGRVTIEQAKPFHLYTVNFLVYQIWDTTSMYNAVVNRWEGSHTKSVDPYHKETYRHLINAFDQWLESHPETQVVRLTTLAYHFAVDSGQNGEDKFRDWAGYQDTVNVEALEDFEREYGYRLQPEDFVDQGYYNAAVRVPSQKYLDWMAFVHRFVVKFGKELVDKIHRAGKRAAIFWGDHWIGVEPYSPGFQEMGVDILIGACEDGAALRRVADAPGAQEREVRLYPYFFPDVFRPGGNPLKESLGNWIRIRRALLRRGVNRIGYGGYLSLAADFPDFVEHVASLCEEFRTFREKAGGAESYRTPVKVAVLNAWGRLRSWFNSFGTAQKFMIKRPDVTLVAGSNLLECLAGLPVEVEFLSFRDVVLEGIPEDVHVIINDGDEETAWSGGRHWADPEVASTLRQWIYKGGGFIGCRGPTAWTHQGRNFQLSDVMGVEKETGQGLQSSRVRVPLCESHFVTDDSFGPLDLGPKESFVYACSEDVRVLSSWEGHVLMACRELGKGRSLFFSALPFSLENARLLYRAILWAAGKEGGLKKWFCSNLKTDCAVYLQAGVLAVVNNTDTEERTFVQDDRGGRMEVRLKPYEIRWLPMKRK